MATFKELQEKRAKSIADARSIQDKADKEKRDLTTDEAKQVDAHLKEANDFKRQADEVDRTEKRRAELEEHERDLSQSRGRQTDPEEPADTRSRDGGGDRGREAGRDAGGRGSPGEPRAFRWRRGGEQREILADRRWDSREYSRDYDAFLRTGKPSDLLQRAGEPPKREDRDLSADSLSDGGALLAPTEMVAGLLKSADDAVHIRQYATVFPVRASQNLGVVSLDADPDDGEWTSEIASGSDDTKMKFGRRELNPMPLAKRIKISRKLLRLSPSVQALVQSRLAYKFNITQEKNFLLGDGANKPLGIFVANTNGISTNRDYATGNLATAIKADNLIGAKMQLKQMYRTRARWFMHRDVITQVQLLKDGNGQYLWRQNLQTSEPDSLCGLPVLESEYAPNTLTTGKYVYVLGDFSYYFIADALQLEIQVLVEKYAEQNQVAYLGRMELDGMPALEEAFVRGKLG